MDRQTRRTFLKKSGAGMATAATFSSVAVNLAKAATLPHLGVSRPPTSPGPDPGIPPHRALELNGVHAYADQESVAAGQSLRFYISSTVPYQMSICRLGSNPDGPSEDLTLHRFPPAAPQAQAIHPGSYIAIDKPLVGSRQVLSLECWVRPWTFGRWQDLITQMSVHSKCDFALAISPEAAVTFYIGNGGAFRQAWVMSTPNGVLKKGEWHHLAAAWDGHDRWIWVNGREAARAAWAPPAFNEGEWGLPLRLGAGGIDGRTDGFLDGDLAMPAIYGRALEAAEVSQRFQEKGLVPARGKEVQGCWPLLEERGATVRDLSSQRRHGRIINHGTWMIGGPSFIGEVPRFGKYDPRRDPQRGHGLRLAADDLYDCRWTTTHAWRVPAEARPGLHVARMAFELDGKPNLYHVTFNVRRSARRPKAPLLVLCASNTWRAYSGTPFAANRPELKQVWGTGGGTELANKPPAFNFYRAHAAGQGTYQIGLRMPWPAAGPYLRYGDKTDYSHLMRADRFCHIWLEQSGYDYDVIMDSDLHRDPAVLRDYSAFLINGHSEYWSAEMWRGLEQYLKRGGNVIVLSGNSLFWRVSFNDDLSLLECRKVDAPGDQVPGTRRGEAWHSQDGLRGGMLRECGWPGWTLIGLESLGWNNPGNPENFGPYLAEGTDHFLFHQPEESGLQRGEKFGWAGEDKLPMANGHEFDVRLSTLAALQEKPAPAGARVPSDPPGIIRLANGIIPWKKGGAAFDYFFRPIKPKTDQGGEMIYWERREGGKVFNAGSIGAGWALCADPKFQTLLRNVLHHFGVPKGAPLSQQNKPGASAVQRGR